MCSAHSPPVQKQRKIIRDYRKEKNQMKGRKRIKDHIDS